MDNCLIIEISYVLLFHEFISKGFLFLVNLVDRVLAIQQQNPFWGLHGKEENSMSVLWETFRKLTPT